MADFPTYAYQGDKIAAFDGDNVIASGTEFEKVAETADQYFEALRQAKVDKSRKEAKRIITPGGQEGTILGRTAGLWSDEITVRLDNGEIRRYDTFVGDGMQFTADTREAPANPVEYFQARLDTMPLTTREGLTERLNELTDIRQGCARLVTAGAPYEDQQKLDKISKTAQSEQFEIKEALDHLASVDEAIEAPKMAYQAAEQASIGGGDSSWLDHVAQQMVAESEAQDFDKLMADGPTTFVGEQDDAVVAHAGTTRELAANFIHSKTAGFQGEAVEEYRERFVAQVEVARRREASYRQEATREVTTQREASVNDVPDDALFM